MTRMVLGTLSVAFLTCVAVEAQQSKDVKSDSKVVQAKAQADPGAAAPPVVLIEGERLKPDEAMVFTRSVLIEEGSSVARMSELQENINTVRHNMNTYRIGYSLPADKVGSRFVFSGPTKGWRATSTGDVSVWPPGTYRVSRDEARRRAKLLEPIVLEEPIDEMNNLRVYYLPSLVGYDGRQYVIIPTTLAFSIHPKTGYRMTVIARDGRTYGAVNKPLAATSNIYVQHVESYPAGPLGIGRAHVPSVFYSKRVQFDMEPFPAGETFDKLMAPVIAAHESGRLTTSDFRALYAEMMRYTGGNTD